MHRVRRLGRCLLLRPTSDIWLFQLPSTFPTFIRRHQIALISSQAQIRLRDYQEECIQSVLKYLKDGHKRLGVSLGTGGGKTVIFTQLIDRVPSSSEQATQTLILAHRRELVEQAARHCSSAYPSKMVDIELGKSHASGTADITIASIQSIMSGDRLSKFDPSRFKLIIVDEAHHIVAPQYLRFLQHFGLRSGSNPSPALIGVSATFSRHDGLRLGAAIDHIVYHKDYVDMINEKWLSDVIFTTVKLIKTDLSKVKTGTNGDFLTSSLSRAVNTDENNELAVRSWLSRASERKSTLVFCVDIQHVIDLTAKFRRHGIDARFVTGDTRTTIRSDTVTGFKAGEFPVLLNCGVFTEGTDIPNIDCMILARPTKSRNLLIQMIGRGMRLNHGKENCHILDMVSSLKSGIVTTPTLYGLDPDEILESATVESIEDIRDRKENHGATGIELQDIHDEDTSSVGSSYSDPTVRFTDYASVNDLLEDVSGDQWIRNLSRNAWVQVGDADYVLTNATGNYLRITKADDDSFRLRYTMKLPPSAAARSKSPYATPRTMVENSPTLLHTLNAADRFAVDNFPRWSIDKTMSWRRGPASDAQIAFLNNFRPEDDQIEPGTITKGQAGDMITKRNFGIQGWYNRLEVKKRRAEREEESLRKTEELRSREQVRVGPLN